MNRWAAEGKYDCNFLCICVIGDASGLGLCREMSAQMKLTHCVNGFVANKADMPTYGQLGCQGFIILDKEHRVVSDATSAFMQVRNLAFEHVEALLEAVCKELPIPDLCPGEYAEIVDAPNSLAKLNGSRGICVKINGDKVDFGFMDGPYRGNMVSVPRNSVRRCDDTSGDEESGQGCSNGSCVEGKCGPGSCQPGTCGPGSCSDGSCKPGSCGPGSCKPGNCEPNACQPGGCAEPNCSTQKVDVNIIEECLNVASVKVESMDSEHEECATALRRLANELSSSALEAVLKSLTDHFAHEEALFEEFDFGAHENEKLSARRSHILDHQRLLVKVQKELSAAGAHISASFVEELFKEFHDHTSRYDIQYADFLSSRGAK